MQSLCTLEVRHSRHRSDMVTIIPRECTQCYRQPAPIACSRGAFVHMSHIFALPTDGAPPLIAKLPFRVPVKKMVATKSAAFTLSDAYVLHMGFRSLAIQDLRTRHYFRLLCHAKTHELCKYKVIPRHRASSLNSSGLKSLGCLYLASYCGFAVSRAMYS